MKPLTEGELRALVVLLGDDDPATVGIARQRLVDEGNRSLPFLRAGVHSADRKVCERSRALVAGLMLEEDFRRFAGQPEDAIDLEEGAFLLARYAYPDLVTDHYAAALDRMARDVKDELGPEPEMLAAIATMNRSLFLDQGFRSNQVHYYDPDNSYLNRVIDRRLGIPITLSTVYILVGRRAGLPMLGVGLPGHFIVRYLGTRGDALIDAYGGGEVLSREQCARFVESMGLTFHPGMLEPIRPRHTLVRMINNLVRINLRDGRQQQAKELSRLRGILLGRR